MTGYLLRCDIPEGVIGVEGLFLEAVADSGGRCRGFIYLRIGLGISILVEWSGRIEYIIPLGNCHDLPGMFSLGGFAVETVI